MEVELTYDYSKKQYGIRQVRRAVFGRPDGWREYEQGSERAFVIPRDQIPRLMKEAEWFVRDRV